ncbi:MAG: hypothetical protein LUQ07_00265, partial [Methanospirillum sp.]|nr:hypothetical protein [Methanospirillum sp.]
FACGITAPQTPGMYLLGIRSRGNITSHPVYSNVLTLTVPSPQTMNDTQEEENHPVIRIEADPQVALLNQELAIRVLLTDAEGEPAGNVPVFMYRSNDGIDWRETPESVMTTDEAGSAAMITRAEKTGYLYFQALVRDDKGFILRSDILAVPVTSPENSA